MEPIVSVRFWVYGRVQGVGFRYAAAEEAKRLGLCGWCANDRGRGDLVLGEVEGPREAVAAFLKWLERGPRLARVARVQSEPVPPRFFAGFEIRRAF